MPFTKGHKFGVGRKHTDEAKKKISIANLGRVKSPETIKRISNNNARFWLGKKRPPHSEATRKLISDKKKGQVAWNKGLIGFRKGEIRPYMVLHDENNPNWKGDAVGYRGLHLWVVKHLGQPLLCSSCGLEDENNRKFHWANKSREYKRELSDWIRLCVKCHRAYDRVENQVALT